MKLTASYLVLVFCLALTACGGPVKELDDYINIKDEIILEMGKKIDTNPTQAGVDEARKVYESRKKDYKAKCAALSDKDLSGDQTQKMLDSAVTHGEMLNLIQSKINDVDAMLKFTELINEFNDTCK